MREIIHSIQFKRDVKLAEKRGKDCWLGKRHYRYVTKIIL